MILNKYILREHLGSEKMVLKILRKSTQIGAGSSKTVRTPDGRIVPATCFKADEFIKRQKEFIRTLNPKFAEMNTELLNIVERIKETA